jgi:cell division protein FtsZ
VDRAKEEYGMTLELQKQDLTELKPRIVVVGVGGAGGNAINNMIRDKLQGVDFVAVNTDAQALTHSLAETRIQLGSKITQGLGAGSRPEIGRAAAEESISQLEAALEGSHMCFITAGMGGGTGTGAAPIVARVARERGILTVGVVTKPFTHEGGKRSRLADEGIAELHKHVDTLIIIPNQNLFRIASERTTFPEALAMADNVLHAGVRGITDLIIVPGIMNLDFADVRTAMSEAGKAMMGTGEADGEDRAMKAAEAAISNPLLDEVSLRGARGLIVNITGGEDLTLFEYDQAANHIREMVDPDANIKVGMAVNPDMNGRIRVSVVATGIDSMDQIEQPTSGGGRVISFGAASSGGFGGGRASAAAAFAVAPAARPAVSAPMTAPAALARPELVVAEPVAEVATAEEGAPLDETVLTLDTAETIVRPSPEIEAIQPLVELEPEPVVDSKPVIAAPIVDPVERPYRRTPIQQEDVRSPSLFQRLASGLRSSRPPVVETPEAPAAGGSDDPMDIPKFLRRQGN